MKRNIPARRLRRFTPAVEWLEPRLAPAWLVDATTVRFYDVDGDLATVQFSQPVLTTSNVNSVFGFNFGDVYTGPLPGPIQPIHQLQILNLTTLPNGLEVRITAEADMGGDGLVNVGFINANGRDVALVKVEGDLGRIQAGDAILTTKALGELRVDSLGGMGLSTQIPGGNLNTIIQGKLGLLKVKGDIFSASVEATGGAAGKINEVILGGSLWGGSGASSGRISTTGSLGPINIGGDISGGSGDSSGEIYSGGSLASIKVGGVFGGSGFGSGRITSSGDMGLVHISGSVVGLGPNSGAVLAMGNLAGVDISGGVYGGLGVYSGNLYSHGNLGAVVIGMDLEGMAPGSGQVSADGSITSVKVGGSVIGGAGISSGLIRSGASMGSVKIASELKGGSGEGSGRVYSTGSMGNVKVGQAVRGGVGVNSGKIASEGDMGIVTIGYLVPDGIVGGIGDFSGQVFAGDDLAEVWIGGPVTGGGGLFSGFVGATDNVGPVFATDSILGGAGFMSGTVAGGGRIASVEVGGSVMSGFGMGSGSIRAGDDLGPVTIHGSIVGIATPAIISGRGLPAPTTTSDLAIASITVSGNVQYALILVGYDVFGVPVNSDAGIGSIVVKGNWTASTVAAGVTAGVDAVFATPDDSLIAGGSPAILAKITSLNIKGTVSGTPGPGDGFGFFAEKVGSLKIGGIVSALNPGAHNDDYFIGSTVDLKLHEL